MNYWYAAHANEIFLDLDSKRALRRAVSVLSVAVEFKRLPIKSIYVYPTIQAGHYHLIVVLNEMVRRSLRLAWGAWMGNDRLRLAYVLARHGDIRIPVYSGDLLVTKHPYYRDHDARCRCKRKHKEDVVTRKCSAMRRLLGAARAADYFARTGERRIKPLKIRVPRNREVTIQTMKGWLKQ